MTQKPKAAPKTITKQRMIPVINPWTNANPNPPSPPIQQVLTTMAAPFLSSFQIPQQPSGQQKLPTRSIPIWNEQTIRQTLTQWLETVKADTLKNLQQTKEHPVFYSGLRLPSADDLTNRVMSLPQAEQMKLMGSGDIAEIMNLPKKLPYLAVGWTPKGEPYYGPQGPAAWGRKLFARIVDPDIYLEGKTYLEKQAFYDKYAVEHPEQTEYQRGLGILGEIAKANPAVMLKLMSQELQAVPSVLVTGLNLGQYYTRKLLAAYGAAVELDNTHSVANPEEYNFLALFAKAQTGIPFGRLPVTSPETNPTIIKETYKRHLAGSEMIYTMAYDQAKAEEYNKRYAQGENPDFIVEDLANPWVELVGSVLLDPTNILFANWGEPASKISRIASWQDDILRVNNPEVAKALELAGKATTDADAIKAIEPVFKLVQEDIAKAQEGMSAWSTSYKLFTPTASGKVAITTKRTYPIFRQIVMGSTPEDAAAIFEAMVLAGSKDVGESTRAIAYLTRTPYAPMFFSAAGTDTLAFVSSFSEKMGGMNRILKSIRGADSTEELLAKIAPAWKSTIEDAFPTFSEMQSASSKVARLTAKGQEVPGDIARLASSYNNMNRGTRAWVGVVNSLDKTSSPVYKLANSFFSWDYMGMSYGYAFRNIFQDSMAVMVEEGKGVAARNFFDQMGDLFTRGSFTARSKQQIIDMLGYLPEEVVKGKGPHAAEEVLSLSSRLKEEGFAGLLKRTGKAIDARTLAEGFESGTSTHIFSYVLRREMVKELDSGFMPGIDEIYKAFEGGGLDKKAADIYMELVRSNYGDVNRANQVFREAAATGSIDSFRLIKIPNRVGNLLDPLAMRQPFDELLARSTSLEEFQAGFQRGLDAISKKAADALDAIPRISPMSADEYGLTDLAIAIKEGDVTAVDEKLFIIRQGALNASNSAHEQAVYKTLENLRQTGYDTQPAWEFYARAKGAEVAATAPIGRDLTRSIFGEGGFFDLSKGKSADELAALWKNIKIPEGWAALGDIPKELTPDKFRNLLFDWWSKNTREFWRRSGMNRASLAENAIRLVTDPIEGLTEKTFLTPDWIRADKMRREMDIWYRVNTWEDVRTLYGEDLVKMASERLPDATMKDMSWNSLSFYGWKRGPRALVNAVNKDRRLAGLAEYVAERRPRGQSLLTYIREHGGIDIKYIRDVTGENKAVGNLATLFREDGVSLDEVARAAAEDYSFNINLHDPTDEGGMRQLINMIREELGGKTHYAIGEELFPEAVTDIYSQIPFSEAVQSIVKRLKGLAPPLPEDAVPFLSQYVSKNESFFAEELTKWADNVEAHWGETQKVFVNPKMEGVLKEMETITKPRLEQLRAGALAIAQGERDWILHAYNDQTYAERALAHLYLFPYWYVRSAFKWPVRLAENPEYLLAYAKYRHFQEQIHAGLPDWWKYNLIISRLPGINLESPLYLNLEQTLNPLYGITGVDYNDKIKRATWYARAADDMTKLGPSLYTPLNWIVAAALYHEGKVDAANRWMGRLMPFTATLEYALYKLNIKTGVRYNNFDPFTQLLMKGIDPYEYAPIGRSAGAWVDEQVAKAGPVTDTRKEELRNMYSAQAQDAVTAQEGPLWKEFVARMATQKAPGRITSFFLGQGFKTRTQSDLQIDNFWNDYIALENARDTLSPLEYRNLSAKLGQVYPWKDSILLSRLPDDARYRSFSYSVLARVAPGQQSELFPPGDIPGSLGISGNMLNAFYESKGDLSKWTKQDKDRFMAAMVDLSALLSIPDYATQIEWNTAKDSYAQLKENIALKLNEPYQTDSLGATISQGVWDKVYYYYNIEERADKEKYIADHPEVEQAMNLLTEGVLTDPQLMKYYGGLDTLERYYTNKMYDELYKQFPPTDPKMETVGDEWSYYHDLKISGLNVQEDVLKRTPGLQQYIKLRQEKRDLMAESYPKMQTLWDTYDYGKWIGRITGDYSLADAYYAANTQLKDYSDASKQLDRQIVNTLASSIGLQAAIDLEALYTQYQNIANEAAYAYRDTHPEMDKYIAAKALALKEVALRVGELAKNLPEAPQMNVRPDFVAQGTTQSALANLIQPSQRMTLAEYIETYKISDGTWVAVQKFFDGDKPLPTEVRDELDYLARAKGENGTTLLLDLAAAYYQQVP